MYEIYERFRDKKGLKDADVSRKTGIGKSTFSDWKSGRSRPKDDKMRKIAECLDISVECLTGKENAIPNAVDENNNPIVLDEDALELLEEVKTRPEMKTLFSVSKKATKEDILKAVKIIEALKGDE